MVSIIAIAGLALDLGHAYVDKTEMQNLLDAAAMSGAMTLTVKGNDAAAETAARDDAIATFDAGLISGGEFETANMTPIIEFSHTLDPFIPGSTPAVFVRARVASYDMRTWLTRIIGKDTVRLAASAVSGPVNTETCELSPIVVCGEASDNDCLTNPNAATCFGYNVWRDDTDPEEQCYLKNGTGGSGSTGQETGVACGPQSGDGTGGGQASDVGPGNFQLLDLSRITEEGQACSGGGKNFVRCALATGVTHCPTGAIPTEPGNAVGPVYQGLNTNFGDYSGPTKKDSDIYPPDIVTDHDNPANGTDAVVFFKEYQERLASGSTPGWDNAPPDGVANRRVKAVVIGNCAAAGCSGACDMPVLAIGCFYLTQPTDQGGGQRVWGQFIGECGGNGTLALTPSAFNQQKIILYKDPDSTDS